VLHVITRMIVGGAQENTMLSCALADPLRFRSTILSGPETGTEGELHSECARRGVPVRIEPWLVRSVHPVKDLVALGRLVGPMRGSDVVHTHSSKAGILGRVAARLARVGVVIHTVHGWPFHDRQPWAVRMAWVTLERFAARLADVLIVVAEADRAEGLRLGIGRPEQYRLIRSGIEIERYRDVAVTRASARERLGVPADASVIGTVGRLGPQKAPLDLLSAFERVAHARPEAHLVLVGDGPQRGAVERAIAAAGLSDRVHLLGLRHDVPNLLRAFDVFALASRWEGLPRVFPQAMAAGLPIVATSVDGATDAIRDGETGFLVPPGRPDVMAERLLALATDRARALRMGAAGLARVGEFSARRMVDQLEALYAEQIGAPAPPRAAPPGAKTV
jgi:glycosyltransferase involved in cell wall biosynthesis